MSAAERWHRRHATSGSQTSDAAVSICYEFQDRDLHIYSVYSTSGTKRGDSEASWSRSGANLASDTSLEETE